MVGYLVFASANLLGYTGGFMVYTALEVYRLPLDWISFPFLMFNFAVVGIVAVFWQKGIPRIVTQMYLVVVSVIMAWIITKLPEWTAWCLLVVLALYDLCAVLTPCGPLKALINLAQQHQDPIPGLLYEADVSNRRSEPGEQDQVVRDVIARPSRPSGTQPTQVLPPGATNQSRPAEAVSQPGNTVVSVVSVAPQSTQHTSAATPAGSSRGSRSSGAPSVGLGAKSMCITMTGFLCT